MPEVLDAIIMFATDLSRLPFLACVFSIALAVVYRILSIKASKTKQTELNSSFKHERSKEGLGKEPYYSITPLKNLDWRDANPLQLRPFKAKYHLTMALENTTLSELVPMDNTYLDRITLRRQLIKDQGKYVVAANPSIKPAVDEFYRWMTAVYLPRRFPTIFKHVLRPGTGHSYLHNLATDEDIPLHPPADPVAALGTLSSHVDDEFLFLRPSPEPADEGKYRLEGFVNCFPSGFDTLAKLNLKLADIHTPVPGYAAKIEKSMDRFFAALPIGKIVKRHNWSVTTNTNLFSLGGNHMYEGEEPQPLAEGELEAEKTVMRCERQTLHRLPENDDCLIFAFKTYQYPLKQIKEEGSGEALAQAVDGLAMGSVPRMAFYKRQVVWGEAVKAYLRA